MISGVASLGFLTLTDTQGTYTGLSALARDLVYVHLIHISENITHMEIIQLSLVYRELLPLLKMRTSKASRVI